MLEHSLSSVLCTEALLRTVLCSTPLVGSTGSTNRYLQHEADEEDVEEGTVHFGSPVPVPGTVRPIRNVHLSIMDTKYDTFLFASVFYHDFVNYHYYPPP